MSTAPSESWRIRILLTSGKRLRVLIPRRRESRHVIWIGCSMASCSRPRPALIGPGCFAGRSGSTCSRARNATANSGSCRRSRIKGRCGGSSSTSGFPPPRRRFLNVATRRGRTARRARARRRKDDGPRTLRHRANLTLSQRPRATFAALPGQRCLRAPAGRRPTPNARAARSRLQGVTGGSRL
jgi:hypothetical protein